MNQAGRIAREKETVKSMMHIYCAKHHGGNATLCENCCQLLEYAHNRLYTCPFQNAKPACNHCQVHCYSRVMRDRVKAVMRYAGPRMLFRHPILSFYHLLDRHRTAPSIPNVTRRGSQTGKSGRQQD